MQITEIAFSSYPVTDIPRARAFYEGVLKLKVTSETNLGEQGHWVEYEIGPGALGIGRAPGWKPTPDGCTVALEVDSFEDAVAGLQAASVPVRMGPIETPVCRMIMVSDPVGNTVIIHKRKPGHH